MSVRRKAISAREALRILTFPRLDGGLDLSELDYRVDAHRSPDMKNLWWQDGVLQCRDGQRLVWQSQEPIRGFAACPEPFGGRMVFHAGSCLYAAEPNEFAMDPVPLAEDVPENPGTFFRYGEYLFYKNRGGFYRMDAELLKAEKMEEVAYVPTVLLNAAPDAPEEGDPYQPLNRLTPLRRACYNVKSGVKRYLLPERAASVKEIKVDGTVLDPANYSFSGRVVEFSTAPPLHNPPVNNTVEIVFSVPWKEEQQQLLEACHAAVFGGGQDLCILLGGSASCPNNVFWNGGTDETMDPTYWPVEHDLIVGDTADAITGFGRQYGDLLVLKERSLWRLEMGIEQLEGRNTPSFGATPLSGLVGCDLPGTAALIENNLVFCNREKGVFQVRSSSAAYETNVRCLSSRVHGGAARGLLRDLRRAANVTAFDDGSRYWLCADDRVYLWDYTVSDFSDPSWFYLEGVRPVAFFRDDDGRLFHLDGEGRLSMFDRSFSDYGAAIEKVYRFPTLDFGTYDRRKHVESVLLSLRADAPTDVQVCYEAEGVTRAEPVSLKCRAWRLAPRDLRCRTLSLSPFAYTFRRRPCLRRVRHFSMTLRNADAGCDLAVVSAQVCFRLAERER